MICSSDSLKTLIIGCGNIAGGFDAKRKNYLEPLTHAGGYQLDGRFDVVACVDPDKEKRIDFMNYWGIKTGFHSLKEVLDSDLDLDFDVISICSPTRYHISHLQDSIKLNPKLIFCEKPLTELVKDAEELVSDCRRNNIKLAVNLSRRWDPYVIKLRQDILDEVVWGKLRGITGSYNKGILNNGIHLVDLLHFLLGDLKLIHAHGVTFDCSETDPTISFWLEDSKRIPIFLSAGHAEDYSIFELQFIFSSGVLAMENGGLFWRERRLTDSLQFEGYKALNSGEIFSGGYLLSMSGAIKNIYDAIRFGAPLLCTGENALSAMRLCNEIKDKVLHSDNLNDLK